MEQLTLFNETFPQGGRAGRRLRKNATANKTQWDLWSQEAEQEKDMALFFLDIRNFTAFA
jgi:hypothetical protein